MTKEDLNSVDNAILGSRPSATSSGSGKGGVLSRISWSRFLLFVLVGVGWLVFDLATKSVADSYECGEVFAGPFAGLIQFRLAHNTGAAWSIFSGSTVALGAIAVVAMIALIIAVVLFSKNITYFESTALGLVLAGGIGNAIDRLSLGYVVDFIQTLFISFPTFNIADVGVTCGVVMFALSFFVRFAKDDGVDGEERTNAAHADEKARR